MSKLHARWNHLRSDQTLVRTAVYYLTFVCLGLGTGATGPTIPALAEQTGATLRTLSGIFLAGSIGYTAGTYSGGRLFDRLRGHPVLGIAQLAAGVLIVFIPLVGQVWLLVGVVAAKGLADGILNTGINTLLVWTHRERTAPYMNGLHFAFGLGALFSPLLAAQVLGFENGYRWVYWVLACVDVLVGISLLSLRTNPAPVVHQTGREASGKGRDRLPYMLVAAAMLFLFFYVGSEITFGNWIYTYALTLGLASATLAAYLNSGFWLSFTIGRLISIPLAIRTAPQRILPFAILGSLGGMVLLLAFPGSLGVLWLAVIGVGFCMAPIWPSGFTLAGQSLQLTARLSSIVLLGDSLGGMILPWLVGQVIEASGAQTMTWLVSLSLALTFLAYLALHRLRPRVAGC